MTPRFHPVALVALLLVTSLLGSTLAATAQAPSDTPAQAPSDPAPAQRSDAAPSLERLFAALKAAPTAESAKYIEGKIWAAWAAAGGDTATLLMTRAKTALDSKDSALALKLLTAIIDIKPDYIEAWNRRATLHFINKDYGAAMADLRSVLAREPRHFGAWAGLGMILNEIGDEKRALEALRRAVELYPHLERVPDLVKRLTETVEGRDI